MSKIVAVMGRGRSGKDTTGAYLVERHGFIRVALADPMKRFCAEVFDFDHDQLHGEERDLPDGRYRRPLTFQFPSGPPNTVWVPLSGGKAFALVDADEAARVLTYTWTLVEKEAGKGNRYAKAAVAGVEVKLHRFILSTMAAQIDHVNGDGLDNRRVNLRACTNQENHANAEKRAGASSPFKGVTFDASRGKWSAKIVSDGVTHNLGRFDSESRAAAAYDTAAADLFGAFARRNADHFLTPRFALQTLGTQWGRACCDEVWIRYALRVAKTLLTDRDVDYTPAGGLFTRLTPRPADAGVVFTDLRFWNELTAMEAAGAVLVRVVRPGAPGLAGGVSGHQSEEEQESIPDEAFDVVLNNDGTIADLHEQIEARLVPLLK